ncbi:hypothetical protein [Streptomyces sp. NPDC059009]|uniref:hypothetical protein n=1 Tax=Streptomyces sp. NPDC059009 TaxID=3346694 RepID=UPI0036D0654E
MAYPALTSQIENPIRDRVAYRLHHRCEKTRLDVGREWMGMSADGADGKPVQVTVLGCGSFEVTASLTVTDATSCGVRLGSRALRAIDLANSQLSLSLQGSHTHPISRLVKGLWNRREATAAQSHTVVVVDNNGVKGTQMALFKRNRDEDETGWIVEHGTGDGMEHRWRLRMDKADSATITQHRPVLEAVALKRGEALSSYLEWVALMPEHELHYWRDRIIDGVASEEEAVLYNAWLDVRIALRERQCRIPGTPWNLYR